MDTMLSLLWPCEDLRGDRGEDDRALCGEKLVFDAVGGLKMTLEFELLKGRRAGFVMDGMGA